MTTLEVSKLVERPPWSDGCLGLIFLIHNICSRCLTVFSCNIDGILAFYCFNAFVRLTSFCVNIITYDFGKIDITFDFFFICSKLCIHPDLIFRRSFLIRINSEKV